MKYQFILLVLLISVLIGCAPKDVKVTISYNKSPQNVYPYSTYGDFAKIYYTLGAKSFEYTVGNHRSIELTVPEKTRIRATYDKYISDASGQRATLEDAFYVVDKSRPVWNF